MSKRDYYDILGVQRGADEDTLKKAFRSKAKEHHPDRHAGDKGAEQKFKELNEAYEVLKDPQKRAAYDRFGHQAFEGGGFGNGRGGHPFGAGAQGAGGFDFGSAFGDIFEDLFGGFAGQGQRGGDPSAPSRGADLRYNMSIPLDEAFKGKQETIKFTTSVSCEVCHGSGAEKGSKPITCPTCNGAGRVRAQQGFFTIERSCSSCSGQGKIIKDPCKTCAGSGRVRKEKTLAVNIPAGVEDGTRIRLSGEGETGVRGGTPGDLYIFLSVKPHSLFKREGANIHCKVPVKFTTATLGGSIEVPTIDGSRVKINIPEGTQSGHQFRLKGKGMSVMRSSQRGDMYVHATVETPVHLSKKQKELLRDFENAAGKDTSPESEGFMSKVREFWADLKE